MTSPILVIGGGHARESRRALLRDASREVRVLSRHDHEPGDGIDCARDLPGHEREPNAASCGRLALPAEGDCLRSPGLGFHALADGDATRSLAADIRKAKRAGGVVHGASGVGLIMVMPLPGC